MHRDLGAFVDCDAIIHSVFLAVSELGPSTYQGVTAMLAQAPAEIRFAVVSRLPREDTIMRWKSYRLVWIAFAPR